MWWVNEACAAAHTLLSAAIIAFRRELHLSSCRAANLREAAGSRERGTSRRLLCKDHSRVEAGSDLRGGLGGRVGGARGPAERRGVGERERESESERV